MSRDAQRAIAETDLRRFTRKLTDPTGSFRWTATRASAAESQYRRFLALCAAGQPPPQPLADADELWHLHILDTIAYAADCQRIFGEFLHHIPT